MALTLLYGRTGIALEMPDGAVPHVIDKPPFPAVAPPAEQIEAAFDTPHGSAPLAAL